MGTVITCLVQTQIQSEHSNQNILQLFYIIRRIFTVGAANNLDYTDNVPQALILFMLFSGLSISADQ